MEVSGKIKVINETKTFGASGFKKREVVITTNEQYPQSLLIEFVQDKCVLLDNYKVGDEVTIAINLRGKEWLNPEGTIKYFNSINGWKIQRVNETVSGNKILPSSFEEMNDFNYDMETLDEDEKLPF